MVAPRSLALLTLSVLTSTGLAIGVLAPSAGALPVLSGTPQARQLESRALTADPDAYVPFQTTVGGRPTGIAVSGITAVVADSAAGAVVAFDTCLPKTCAPESTASAPSPVGADPGAVAVAGDAAYVANAGGGLVTVLALSSGVVGGVRATIPVGGTPAGIAADPSGARVYVTDSTGNRLVVVDAAANTVVAAVPVGAGPQGVAVDGGRAYVANQRDATVSVVDLASGAVVQTIPVGTSPGGLAVAQGRLVVADNGAGAVSIVDLAAGTVSATVAVGSQPWGVAVAGTAAFVANYGSGTVSVIDLASARVVATVTVGSSPFGVAVNAQSVFVTNSGSGTVSTIVREAATPAPSWSVRKRARTVTGTVPWSAAVDYAIVARKGSVTRTGRCAKAGASATCRIRLARGEWRVSVLRKLPWQPTADIQQGKRVRF